MTVTIGPTGNPPPKQQGEQRVACNFCRRDFKEAGPMFPALFPDRDPTFICYACVERFHERVLAKRARRG